MVLLDSQNPGGLGKEPEMTLHNACNWSLSMIFQWPRFWVLNKWAGLPQDVHVCLWIWHIQTKRENEAGINITYYNIANHALKLWQLVQSSTSPCAAKLRSTHWFTDEVGNNYPNQLYNTIYQSMSWVANQRQRCWRKGHETCRFHGIFDSDGQHTVAGELYTEVRMKPSMTFSKASFLHILGEPVERVQLQLKGAPFFGK